jgi:hypothetical protein
MTAQTATQTKISKLTSLNVHALNTVLTADQVTTTATTATFPMDPWDAAEIIRDAMANHPSVGHPNQSLHAVLRKLDALTPVAVPETVTDAEMAPFEQAVADVEPGTADKYPTMAITPDEFAQGLLDEIHAVDTAAEGSQDEAADGGDTPADENETDTPDTDETDVVYVSPSGIAHTEHCIAVDQMSNSAKGLSACKTVTHADAVTGIADGTYRSCKACAGVRDFEDKKANAPLGTNEAKQVVVQALLHAAGNLVEFWNDLPEAQGPQGVTAEQAQKFLARWMNQLPGDAWDTRLGLVPGAKQ